MQQRHQLNCITVYSRRFVRGCCVSGQFIAASHKQPPLFLSLSLSGHSWNREAAAIQQFFRCQALRSPVCRDILTLSLIAYKSFPMQAWRQFYLCRSAHCTRLYCNVRSTVDCPINSVSDPHKFLCGSGSGIPKMSIRIRIQDPENVITDPDPGSRKCHYVSGSGIPKMSIRNQEGN